ncbi:MAG: MerR family transcriptional regulator [Vampirovibrio sp.]|nr:MerR family transcriptional regulator [Vampirovibrio sp.]
MYTVDEVVASLKKFDIPENTLKDWENQLGIVIPQNSAGTKQYSPHHINLFKNIKKQLTLGKPFEDIKQLVTLPPDTSAVPVDLKPYASTPQKPILQRLAEAKEEQDRTEEQNNLTESVTPETRAPEPEVRESKVPEATSESVSNLLQATISDVTVNSLNVEPSPQGLPPLDESSFTQPNTDQLGDSITNLLNSGIPASKPKDPQAETAAAASTPAPVVERPTPKPVEAATNIHSNVLHLVEKLMGEKDQVQSKLVEAERLNTHLYNANQVFHKKIHEMTQQIDSLRIRTDKEDDQHFKMLDEKDKLHKQLLEVARRLQLKEVSIRDKEYEVETLQKKANQLEDELNHFRHGFRPEVFLGDWEERSHMKEIVYDNFGINIESNRTRRFRIAHVPDVVFYNSAIITTHYEYETNSMWKRTETLMATCIDPDRIDGQLTVEYIADDVPVTKVIYRTTCHRHRE